MKRIIYLLLLVAMVGGSMASVMPQPLVSPSPINLPQPPPFRWLGLVAATMPRLFAPSWIQIAPMELRAPKRLPVDPYPPPVCDVSCFLRPMQSIAQ